MVCESPTKNKFFRYVSVILLLFTATGSFFIVFSDLIDLLGGKTHLAYDVAIGLGEAVEQMLAVAEGYNVTDLVEVEVGVDCMGAKWLVLIVKLAVASVKDKAVGCVTKSTLANTVEFIVGKQIGRAHV